MLQLYGGRSRNNDGGASLPTFTEGSVLFAAPDGSITEDNPRLFWDNTLKRLGVGNNAPVGTFDVLTSSNNRFIFAETGIFVLGAGRVVDLGQRFNTTQFINVGVDGTISSTVTAADRIVNFGLSNNIFRSGIAFGVNNNLSTGLLNNLRIAVGINNFIGRNDNCVVGFDNTVNGGAFSSVFGRFNRVKSDAGNANINGFFIGNNNRLETTSGSEYNYFGVVGASIRFDGLQSFPNRRGSLLFGYNYSYVQDSSNIAEFVFDASNNSPRRAAAGLHFAAYERNQLSIGSNTSDLEATATNLLALRNGTLATTSPADTTIVQSADISAGNTTIALQTEGTDIVQTIADTPASRTITISVNGVLYDILANPTPVP